MKCVLCGNTSFQVITNKLRYTIPRKVVKCDKCTLISLENPTENVIDYSGPDYRKLYSPVVDKFLSPKEFFDLVVPFQKSKIERVKKLLNPTANVLEIGSSTGHFLYLIKDKVSKVVGIELDPRHAMFARDNCKIDVYEKPIENVDFKEKFDVIFMFQVFEHIQNPIEFLTACKKYLKPSGTIYLEVPNINDVLLSVYGLSSFKERYYRVPHIYYYSEDTLAHMMQKCGFNGTTGTAQDYSLFNHINWLLNEKPQDSLEQGYNLPKWNSSSPNRSKENDVLQQWFHKINEEYKKLLEQNGIAENICYTGKL